MERKMTQYLKGLKNGIPIALGYLSVSFTFGILAAREGLSPFIALIISMTNLTSAGQFAGTLLMTHQAGFIEIGMTTFVINIRYALMSLSLSQKVVKDTSLLKRGIMASGITDEIFTVAALEENEIDFAYFLGLMSLPYLGWALGTFIGAVTDSLLTSTMQNATGIALYGMFIALIIPAAKHSHTILYIVVITIIISCLIYYTPLYHLISSGYAIIIAAILGALIGAKFFPREVD